MQEERPMRRFILATLFAVAWPFTGAVAAPQALGLIASGETPTELNCIDGTCSAEFSAFCLQQSADTPRHGTPYSVVDGSALSFVVTDKNGAQRRVPATGLTVRSARSFAAAVISVPESTLRALGGDRISIAVGSGTALAPQSVANDANPQTARDVADAVEKYRKVGQGPVRDGSSLSLAFRGMMAMINALPRGEKRLTDTRESQRARETLQSTEMTPEARLFTAERLQHCEGLAASAWVDGGLRPCLESQHDAFVSNLNQNYWKALRPGS
jgi:hypothetical protein